jgi:hypothetical protein
MASQLQVSIKLTNIMRNELNYLSWVWTVKISLKYTGKHVFVTGTARKPSLSLVPTAEEIKAQDDMHISRNSK